jgi:hypothetical protein
LLREPGDLRSRTGILSNATGTRRTARPCMPLLRLEGLFSMAMYNAGSMRIRPLRREAARRGSRRN